MDRCAHQQAPAEAGGEGRIVGLCSGKLAELAGVNVETLRFYECKGLLPKPPRSSGRSRILMPRPIAAGAFFGGTVGESPARLSVASVQANFPDCEVFAIESGRIDSWGE